jgi:hypothetical protein
VVLCLMFLMLRELHVFALYHYITRNFISYSLNTCCDFAILFLVSKKHGRSKVTFAQDSVSHKYTDVSVGET